MDTKVLTIAGMSCEHCKKAVADALKGVAGVESVEVDLAGGKATVRYDPTRASEAAMREAVEEAGYEVVGA
ncbi:MAG: heavy-metal-associated domain-containing protein [Firmicutes bacterium]|nr:heavy-metal-associated domain-containing protein [Bacillota bacterium]